MSFVDKTHNYDKVPIEGEPYYWHSRTQPRLKSFWSLFVPIGEDVTNLAVNGGFEANLNRWTTFGVNTQITRSTEQVKTGGYSGKLENIAAVGLFGTAVYNFDPEWTDNQVYTICVSVLGNAGSTVTLDTTGFDDSGFTQRIIPNIEAPCFQHSDRASAVMDGVNWYRLCIVIPAQPLPGTAEIFIQSTLDVGESIYIDDLVIFAGTRALEYFDGNTVGGTWNGPINGSTSTLSRFATGSGEQYNLSELGLDIFGDSGWGMAPVDLITRTFARFDGAELKRVRRLPRVFNFSGTVESCPIEMHRRRKALIEALTYRFDEICPQEFTLCYQLLTDCDEPITKALQIPVRYTGGLEGLRNDLMFERLNLQLTANTQPLWCEKNENSVIVESGVPFVVNHLGSAPAPFIVEFRASVANAMTVRSVINNTTVTSVVLHNVDGAGPPFTDGKGIGPGNVNIMDTTPGSFQFYSPGATNPDQLRFVNFQDSDITLMRLAPGENEMIFDFDEGAADAEVIMRWRNWHVSADTAQIIPGMEECC